ncbi:MAG: phosphoribosylformimino-5-aminoimidazole carboxamide ribotide isomerase [Eubacteriales bacterium]|nr:phosphoribosylformimino-5-aminoimidazole carboxamide ribotide isomerase [Eubacteriales bacterium]
MRFRPCIDIHNGKVKQIVGGSLRDRGDYAKDNFVSEQDAAFYARLYQRDGLKGGHIILLNPESSEYYDRSRQQAMKALAAYPQGLQVGGGIRDDNAQQWLEAGATHVIATSFVFREGRLDYGRLERLERAVGKEHLVLDLSCRLRDGAYWIVTDRWQRFTDVRLSEKVLTELAGHCDEFLIHAVDVEGKANGIEEGLATMLGTWNGIPVTYAGGVGSFQDLETLRSCGQNRLDVTIGSALDLFGGAMEYQKVLESLRS